MASVARNEAWYRVGTLAIIVGIATVFLLWGLGDKYLWQDEANTGVLAARLLRFGRPLAYDGVNLVSIDHFAAEDATSINQRTNQAAAAVDYYVGRGDFKPDTTWKFHPWGQFVVAALGLKLLGQTTIAVRLPFALAGIATVFLVYWLVLRACGSSLTASIAGMLLTFNAYWILHSRQARYYALSSLFFVLTLIAFARWQRGDRWGAPAFVMAALCWFQSDYGTVWPVFGILFAVALIEARRPLWHTLFVATALAGVLGPFVYYYELWGRRSVQAQEYGERFWANLFNLNEYVAPALVVLGATALVAHRWKVLPESERRLVTIACMTLIALAFWVPFAAPQSFLRYSIIAAPAGAIIGSWLVVRIAGAQARWAWVGAAILIVTPWLSAPLHAVVGPPPWIPPSSVLRPELSILASAVFRRQPDPNKLVVDWLKRNAQPTDEILINYEDLPLIYYLPNPIRGGIAAFRVEDDAKTPPRFLILRRTVGWVHWPVFLREMQRYAWEPVALDAPDLRWGNNPDPMAQSLDARQVPRIYVARRADRAQSTH